MDTSERSARARFVARVQEALGDCDAGRLLTDEELSRRLDAHFGSPGETTPHRFGGSTVNTRTMKSR